MKYFLSLLLCASAFAVGEDVQSVPDDPTKITIVTASNGASTENIKDVLANYPALAPKVTNAIAAKMLTEDESKASKRMDALATMKVDLPKTDQDKIQKRIDAFRTKKEAALMKVKDANPERAKAKMDELLAVGIVITQKTKDAVNAAQPTPSPTATPQPTPNDGL